MQILLHMLLLWGGNSEAEPSSSVPWRGWRSRFLWSPSDPERWGGCWQFPWTQERKTKCHERPFYCHYYLLLSYLKFAHRNNGDDNTLKHMIQHAKAQCSQCLSNSWSSICKYPPLVHRHITKSTEKKSKRCVAQDIKERRNSLWP